MTLAFNILSFWWDPKVASGYFLHQTSGYGTIRLRVSSVAGYKYAR